MIEVISIKYCLRPAGLRRILKLGLFGGIISCACNLCAQGTFINLGFEDAKQPLTPNEGHQCAIVDALPGWQGYIDGAPQDMVVYDSIGLGSPSISIHDPNSPWKPLVGNYSVYLQAPWVVGMPVSLGQTGRVPENAQSLRFLLDPFGYVAVSFAGKPLQEVALGTSATHRVVGVDISPFAGQVGELRFSAGPGVGSGELDFIFFSTQPVPEPATVFLLLLGLPMFVIRFWRQPDAKAKGKN